MSWTYSHRLSPSASSSRLLLAAAYDHDDHDDADEHNDSTADSSFMAALQQRIQQVENYEQRLPLVVLDSMLPRQVLRLSVQNDLLKELIRQRLQSETPYFGMTGLARLKTGQQVHLKSGVKVEVVGKPIVTDKNNKNNKNEDNGTKHNVVALQVHLKAGPRFRIAGEVETVNDGWTQAKVEYLDPIQEDRQEEDSMSLARAMQKAREFGEANVEMKESKSLVDMWLELARQRERHEGQIDQLLEDLGPMPSWENPSDCAFWVGALINPIPAMGVAMEIRPQLLCAKTAEERTQIALDGIWNSIQKMQGYERFYQTKE